MKNEGVEFIAVNVVSKPRDLQNLKECKKVGHCNWWTMDDPDLYKCQGEYIGVSIMGARTTIIICEKHYAKHLEIMYLSKKMAASVGKERLLMAG